MRLTQGEVRAALLAAQGLLHPPPQPATKADVLETIRRMGVLQIDTIHVVARSPYFVLWSRLGDYDPVWLDELLAEGAVFETWAHAACFLPSELYPHYRRLILDRALPWVERSHAWLDEHADVAEVVRSAVRDNGPVRSADFERRDGKTGGWWNWKPEKTALECLFATGEVMIARRENFQRLYDLRERVRPDWDDAATPPLETVLRDLAVRSVRALGVASARWAPDYYRAPKRGTAARLAELAEAGEIVPVDVEDWREPGYVHPEHLPLVEAAFEGEVEHERTTLLSPFDPIVWDRARAQAWFGFDYMIECYTPEPKRRYGYFTLPILHRGALVGRVDAKAHRREGRFEVKALHLEPGVDVDVDLLVGLAGALAACAGWHRTPHVTITRSDPAELAASLGEHLTARTDG